MSNESAKGQGDVSLGDKLEQVIQRMPAGEITVAEIRDLVGQEGLLFLCALLTLVFMIPVSPPGVSTVFGAAILMIGVCRLFGKTLWLPRRIRERRLSSDGIKAALGRGAVWFHRLAKISRPHRVAGLLSGPGDLLANLALILGAVLLMAPFGLIPFSNTLPALAILLLSIGILQRDGGCVLLGHVANLGTLIYFGVLIALAVKAGKGLFHVFSGG